MGIRFLCDQCSSRIHVKDFLAGRRAKCPHCGCKMSIPMESTVSREEVLAKSAIVTTEDVTADSQKAAARLPDKSKTSSEKADSSDSAAKSPSAKKPSAEKPSAEKPTAEKPTAKTERVDQEKRVKANKAQPKKPEAKPTKEPPQEAPNTSAPSKRTKAESSPRSESAAADLKPQPTPAAESKKKPASKEKARTVKPAAKETDANSGAISETFQDVVPKRKSEESVGLKAEETQEVVANEASSGVSEHVQSTDDAARSVSKPDLFEEDPNALWYVAPPSGGKYGPADAKMMRGWIEEGRVSADSLVWREGWDDWRSATVIMPGSAQSTAVVPPEPDKTSVVGDSAVSPADQSQDSPQEESRSESDTRVPSSMRYHRERSKSRMMGILLIACLALVSIGLLVWLIIAVSTGP